MRLTVDEDIGLQAEFEKLFKSRFTAVRYFIFKMIHSEADANDLAQDVFTFLWSKPDIWFKKDSDQTDRYLYTVARNKAIDFIRHEVAVRHFKESWEEQQLVRELFPDSEAQVSRLISYKECCYFLRTFIDRLPEQRRKIFRLSRFQLLSNREIAEKLGLSVRTVECQIHLALSELKKLFLLFIIF
ncbi:RNA polymerase sigma-70, Bacteroidetes type [gut metagenome]|uniref:RNA polymerase sigma-70, Bacteroidetes type n=1 Tax=gut metagenome TaxID=749906 RepID=J9H2L7_9ZZZZ